jgi:hypothetical protein
MRDINSYTSYNGSTLAPFVRAYFFIRRLNYGSPTTFLLDTGSGGTYLHGRIAYILRAKMDEKTLGLAHGIGGSSEYYFEENAVIVFFDKNGKSFELKVPTKLGIQKITKEHVEKTKGDVLRLPSIIGREIMNQGDFRYHLNEGISNLYLSDVCTQDCSIPYAMM